MRLLRLNILEARTGVELSSRSYADRRFRLDETIFCVAASGMPFSQYERVPRMYETVSTGTEHVPVRGHRTPILTAGLFCNYLAYSFLLQAKRAPDYNSSILVRMRAEPQPSTVGCTRNQPASGKTFPETLL